MLVDTLFQKRPFQRWPVRDKVSCIGCLLVYVGLFCTYFAHISLDSLAGTCDQVSFIRLFLLYLCLFWICSAHISLESSATLGRHTGWCLFHRSLCGVCRSLLDVYRFFFNCIQTSLLHMFRTYLASTHCKTLQHTTYLVATRCKTLQHTTHPTWSQRCSW